MYCRSDAWVGVTRVLYFKHAEKKLHKCLDTRAEEKVYKTLKIRDTLQRREAAEEITKQLKSVIYHRFHRCRGLFLIREGTEESRCRSEEMFAMF